jgi:tRNA pseudouridine13 synthase
MTLPYLTNFPGIGGAIKQRVEDFQVTEVPLYEPAGEGEHVYAEIQKAGLTTFAAIHRLAKALNVNSRDIGYAGLKDANAMTRQVVSIQGVSEEAVRELSLPDVQVLWAARHGNKLRLGHLKANRFVIKVRDVDPADVVKLQPVIAELQKRGMPNYFGEQRFGMRKNNHLLGAALLAGDNSKVLHLLLGSPDPAIDDSQAMGARKAFDQNDFDNAMRLFPRRCGMERRVLHRFRSSRRPGLAVREIDEKLRRLWISATQSEMFNQVLARRIGTIDTLIDGDLAWKHENGACFAVESVEAERARAEAFEVSATGPLVGYRMTLPKGEALAIEQAVMQEHGLSPESFRVEGKHRIKGARRPLRVRPEEVEIASGVDEHGPHVTLAFTLPAGSFATVLLREVMKNEGREEAREEVVEEEGEGEAAAEA